MKICPTIIEILTFDKWSLKFTVSKSVLSYLRSMDLTDVSIGALWSTPQVWLPCSNAAKTRYPLKHDGVPQTPETISVVSGPKFTILWGHVEEILLLNKFFSDCRYMPWLRRYSLTKLCDGAQMAIFDDFFWVLHFQRAACRTFQTCILNLH